MILRAPASMFHTQTPLCPVNFNAVYWGAQSNPDVCWQKFYRWWQDSINSMGMMLKWVSEKSYSVLLALYLHLLLCKVFFTEAKDKTSVSMSYRDLLTHTFLLPVWGRHIIWWFVTWTVSLGEIQSNCVLIDTELDSWIGLTKPLQQDRFLSFLWCFPNTINIRRTLHDSLVFQFIFWLQDSG